MDKDVKNRLTRIYILFAIIGISFLMINGKDGFSINALAYNQYNDTVVFEELSDGIKLENALPVIDQIGSSYEGYKFKISNGMDEAKEVVVSFVNTLPDDYDKLDYKDLRYQILKNDKILVTPTNLSSDGVLFSDTVINDSTYELIMWIDYNASNEVMNKYFSGVIKVEQK